MVASGAEWLRQGMLTPWSFPALTSVNISNLLEDYARDQPKRATGGLYALAGFDYQLRLYVAQLVEGLAKGGDDPDNAGQVFLEALSDLAVQKEGGLVCIQAKRTLTRTTLRDAAAEVCAIEAFFRARRQELRGQARYKIVAFQGDNTLSWGDLSADASEKPMIEALAAENRLLAPEIEPDPQWSALVAVWNRLDDPFGFLRYALDRALRRTHGPEDARQVRDDICERYAQHRKESVLPGQLLRAEDFDLAATLSRRLEIGNEVTLARVRDRQYMPRDGRRDTLYAAVEERFDLSRRDLQSAARVFWLSGRSGVGKSVLLLQVVERLVRDGRRVLWLGGAAEKLEPVLRAVADQSDELRPEFIAVDDLYDRDARTRLRPRQPGRFY